jgi:asparagine synthase (glutamine-hydrolysing)
MPFMDWRLVTYAVALPDESKVGRGFTKLVEREAMRGVMPEALRLRKAKIGFNSPLPDWFRGPLKSWVAAIVSSREFLASELWDGPAVRAYVQSRLATDRWSWQDASRVWPYLHAQAWRTSFLGRAA